jgi:hypothetical protein
MVISAHVGVAAIHALERLHCSVLFVQSGRARTGCERHEDWLGTGEVGLGCVY